ncbi:MAG: hypothetical protein QG632_166 [Candidatus Dependentiae bacterium]|nr:hypothetical protein [Candidatus Dependentiae bacterium]
MNQSSPTSLADAFTPLYTYQLPAWWQTTQGMMIIGAGTILFTLVISFLVWYRYWYRPPLTLEQWSTQELKALGFLLSRQPINYKRFFGAATFFFKQYLVRLHGWKVLDKTDDELWDFVSGRSEIPAKLHPAIKELLSYAQVVKFADAQALAEKAEEAQHYLEMIISTLQETHKDTKNV